MNIIQYKGKIYLFPKTNEVEPTKINNDRLWFIVRNLDKGSFEYINNLSYIWMNNKYYNLEYDHHILGCLDDVKK